MCDLTYDTECADIPALHRINIYKFAVNRAGVLGFLVQVSGTPFLHVVVLAQVFGYLCLRCEGVVIEVFTSKYCQQSCIWLWLKSLLVNIASNHAYGYLILSRVRSCGGSDPHVSYNIPVHKIWFLFQFDLNYSVLFIDYIQQMSILILKL